jgi:hypothetical protein
MPILMAIKKELLGDNPLYFCFQFISVSLSLGSCYLCSNLSLSFLFHFLLPRVASNGEEVRFGEVVVQKQISVLHCKKS